ncbi:zinc finger BED domain-containing protein RICESLEEPER 2-like [Senna tora]|uniref:Zinc finger BED domain-containing protein RICESLEEPER 2-like n=1 Tax=Senna tora TaxID=362788 RepID=A0A834TGM7_9FABA|nr:zinc finger BED domain-containing protein RICESLEEPER 2-like [Senna tora]
MWTSSNQNKGYMSITTHFIDDNWQLQSRLVRFIYVPAPHNAEVLCNVLVECLLDWNLDRKISTLTLDNCTTNDVMVDLLCDRIPTSSFILGGSLLYMRCCAHILNLIVKDGLSTIYDSIEKIRQSVAYWVAIPKREEKFEETCRQLGKTYSRKLALDCRTRWNSTYLMLASALPYQEVFKRLKQRESQYKCLPSDENWTMASEIGEKLEIFYMVTELFSGTQYPTSNVYFPKVCQIKFILQEWLSSPRDTIRSMTTTMLAKFDKYWSTINGVMTIGTILDPRIGKGETICTYLVAEYQSKEKNSVMTLSDSATSILTDVSSLPKQTKWDSGYFRFVNESACSANVKSELDYYLEETVLLSAKNQDKNDILAYWKMIGAKYPTLQKNCKR